MTDEKVGMLDGVVQRTVVSFRVFEREGKEKGRYNRSKDMGGKNGSSSGASTPPYPEFKHKEELSS